MKSTIVSIIIALTLIGSVVLTSGDGGTAPVAESGEAVSIVDGVQIVEIRAKGGYWPKKISAQSGIPTVLRFKTEGTYDCSSSVVIPSKGISTILPQTGSTDIDIGESGPGKLRGSCGMGMYPFEVDFKDVL
jgi:plastocyanin domain-containing protein